MAYKFEPDEGVQEAVLRCAREQLDNAIHALSEGIDRDPVEAVHTARKAVKKERSLLRLARGGLDAKQRPGENQALRGAARGLSGARDAEVMLETLDELSERFAGQVPKSTFAAAREPLERERATERTRMTDSATVTEALECLTAVRSRVDDWRLRGEGWEALDRGLVRIYGRGRMASKQVRQDPSTQHLHEWRKRVKDLWYALRLLAPVGGPIVRGQAREAHRLADLLGDDHDLAVLHENLQRLEGDVAADTGELLGLIGHRRDELQAEAAHVGKRLYQERPTAFTRRLRGYWKAGQAENRSWHERSPAELAEKTRAVSAA